MIANIYEVCTLPIYKRFLYSDSIVYSFLFGMVTPSSPQMSGGPNDFLNKNSEHTAPLLHLTRFLALRFSALFKSILTSSVQND